MQLRDLKNKKVIILGFGVEGKATLKFLRYHFPKQIVTTADKKDGSGYLKKQESYGLAIRSPGVPKRFITIPSTTATNIFFANVKGMVIGITGSKGKGTTAALTHSILLEAGIRSHLVGNIGNPMLTEILKQHSKKDIFVAELSSFQLDDIAYSPHISVIVNLFTDHLDYHKTRRAYIKAKKRIVAHAKHTDYFVYNPAFKELRNLARHTKAKAIPFIETVPFAYDRKLLPGKHIEENMRAAITVARLLSIPTSTIVKGIKAFEPLPHRLEYIGDRNGIHFYDDSAATIPEATLCALKTLGGDVKTLITGGSEKGTDFSKLRKYLQKREVASLILFPPTGKKIGRSLRIKKFYVASMKEAIGIALRVTPKGKICLLSPASASFSLFRDYKERGDLFKKLIRDIKHRLPH